MKTILVLTDFSPAAEHAARYALQLARALNLNIRLAHVRAESEPELTSDQWGIYLKKLKKGFRIKAGEMPLPAITFIDVAGNWAAVIRKLAEEDRVPLVIMGLTGAGHRKDTWGTHVGQTLDILNAPLLLVPESATYRQIKKIGYATDLANHELPLMRSVITLARDFQAPLIFWYITMAETDQRSAKQKLDSLLAQVDGYSSNVKVSIRLLLAQNAAEGLYGIAENGDLQLLVVSHEHRPLLEYQTAPGHTLTLARQITIPLLVYPKHPTLEALTVF